MVPERTEAYAGVDVSKERLARIIHERSGWLRFARGKADEDPSKAAKSPHIDSDRSKSRSPYSSTKLGFVNNPG